MLHLADYRLIDFGRGRKLERFGERIVDRPCPAAQTERDNSFKHWRHADDTYVRDQGQQGSWRRKSSHDEEDWSISLTDTDNRKRPIRLGLHPTATGQLGVFPEQLPNWNWIAERLADLRSGGNGDANDSSPTVLNLFAYTGAASLVAANQGASVVHVDAARTSVNRARQNAETSHLHDAPIRWIIDDVRKFVARELRRGSRFDGLILDPPTYGHGPKGQRWEIERDLGPLLDQCLKLTTPTAFVVLTTHSPDFDDGALTLLLQRHQGARKTESLEALPLYMDSESGKQLASGYALRWQGGA